MGWGLRCITTKKRTPHGTSSHRVRLTPHHHKGTNTAWHVIPWGEAYAASPTRNEPHNAWRSTTEVGLSCTTDKERNTTTHGAAQHGWGLRCTTDKERNTTTHGAAQQRWNLRRITDKERTPQRMAQHNMGGAYAAPPTRNETPQRMAQHNMGGAYAHHRHKTDTTPHGASPHRGDIG